MTGLLVWLREQLNEDERVALAATPGPWKAVPVVYGPPDQGWGEPAYYEVQNTDGASVVDHQTHEGGGAGKDDAIHIARHDPARVLRQVAAMRKMLELHAPITEHECVTCYCSYVTYPCPTVLALAEIYADRPGYHDEWAAA